MSRNVKTYLPYSNYTLSPLHSILLFPLHSLSPLHSEPFPYVSKAFQFLDEPIRGSHHPDLSFH